MSGVQSRNRALEGDLVAIELNNEAEWKVLNDQIMEKVRVSGFFLLILAHTLCLPIDGMTTIIIIFNLYNMETLDQANLSLLLHFQPTTLCQEKNPPE